jgi:hypothetical protein
MCRYRSASTVPAPTSTKRRWKLSPVTGRPRPENCSRTTRAIILSEAWPINNAQNKLQMLCGRRSLPTLHFLDNANAAKAWQAWAALSFTRPIDSQQADAFVLNEVGSAGDSEEPAGGTAPRHRTISCITQSWRSISTDREYFDPTLTLHSPDPSDPVVTKRVITTMRAEEY